MREMITVFLILFAFGSGLIAQSVVDVVGGLSVPFGLELHNDELYITSQNTAGSGFAGKIVKIDPSQSNPTPEVVVEFPISTAVAFYGDIMYAANFNSIVKVDLTAPNPTPEVVLPNLAFPNGLLVIEDELYFCQTTAGSVDKIDLTQAIPTVQPVVTSGLVGPIDLAHKDGVLYIAENDGGNIASANLADATPTASTLVSGLLAPISISLDGDYLYTAVLGEVVRIHLLDDDITFISVTDVVSQPYGSVFIEGELHLTEFGLDKVVKIISIPPVWEAPAAVCASETSATIGGASPSGGVYSGTGVSDNGNGQDFTFDATVAGTGMTTITYTLDGQSVNVQLEVTAAPEVSAVITSNYNGQAISCAGASDGVLTATISGGTTPYSYLWSNGANTASISGLGEGTYSVTVTDGNTCTGTSSMMITAPSAIAISTSSTEATAGMMDGTASVSASGGTAPYTYLWTPGGQTTATATGLAGGTYQVVVTDVNGCEMTGSVVVEEVIVVTFTSPPNYCLDDGLQTGLGGGSPLGGVYSGPGVVDNSYSLTYSFDPAVAGVGIHTITYEYEGQTASGTVEVFPLPVVSFTAPGPFNVDDGEQMLTGGVPEGGVYSGPGVNGLVFNPAAAGVGVHNITYTYTDGNGCNASASGLITVEMMLPPDNECGGANDLNALFGQTPNEPQLSTLYNNTGYTATPAPNDGFECFVDASLQHTIWYTFEGDGNTYLIRTVQCNATDYIDSGDTQAAIYSGDCAALTPVACNDDEDEPNQVYNISIELETEAGTTYHMMIDGWNGAEGEFCVEVTNLTTSTVTNIEQSNIQLFPNPTTGILHLTNVDARLIEVYNNQGQLVLVEAQPGNSVDIATVPAGLYYIKLYAEDKVYSAKIIKE